MIIKSPLDDDFYKFMMQQAVLHNYPGVMVEYEFKCRNDTDLRPYIKEIQEEVSNLVALTLSSDEAEKMLAIPFVKEDYIDFLYHFHYNPDKYVKIENKNKKLCVHIKGPWLQTILFECKILAIISEVYSKHEHLKRLGPDAQCKVGWERFLAKIKQVEALPEALEFKFADFGMRRRFSYSWHDIVIYNLKTMLPKEFVGTSNVHLAFKHGVKPIGTMAHEWIMAHQSLARLDIFQRTAFEVWGKEYRADLGIALSDTVGMKCFLRDFDKFFAMLYKGARHDSADPYWWGDELIKHYQSLDINPMEKHAVFSDGLNFDEAIKIAKYFFQRIIRSFGIGTNLTNDMGIIPLPIVLKMVMCNGWPVAKECNDSGKSMCIDEFHRQMLRRYCG